MKRCRTKRLWVLSIRMTAPARELHIRRFLLSVFNFIRRHVLDRCTWIFYSTILYGSWTIKTILRILRQTAGILRRQHSHLTVIYTKFGMLRFLHKENYVRKYSVRGRDRKNAAVWAAYCRVIRPVGTRIVSVMLTAAISKGCVHGIKKFTFPVYRKPWTVKNLLHSVGRLYRRRLKTGKRLLLRKSCTRKECQNGFYAHICRVGVLFDTLWTQIICGSGYCFALYNEMDALYLAKAPLTLPTDWKERRVIVHIDSPNNAEKPQQL